MTTSTKKGKQATTVGAAARQPAEVAPNNTEFDETPSPDLSGAFGEPAPDSAGQEFQGRRQQISTQLRNLLKENGSLREKADELLLLAMESRRDRNTEATVAPFVKPERRLKQSAKQRSWKEKGFTELSPGTSKLRHRILPRTVIGISFMLLASAVGVAFSGAAFYAYYDNRLAENEREVSRFVDGFDEQFNDATGAIEELRTDAVEDIRTELKPIEGVVSDADGVVNLPATAGESVWALKTRDEEGAEVLGSAFAMLEHQEGTMMITSYSLVSASATVPSPPLTLTKKDQTINAQLWSWDVERDLALLLVVEKLAVLELANPAEQTASVGTRVFAMSGFGGQGSTASPGILLDQSSTGLQHTAAVGSMFRGGPILNGSGKVVGLATLTYQPTGVDPGMVLTAPDSAAFCAQILRCASTTEELALEVSAEAAVAPPAANAADDAGPEAGEESAGD